MTLTQGFSNRSIVTTSVLEEGGARITPYRLKRKTLGFVGSSGVGKSTLINAALGEDRLKTNAQRNDGKGRQAPRGGN